MDERPLPEKYDADSIKPAYYTPLVDDNRIGTRLVRGKTIRVTRLDAQGNMLGAEPVTIQGTITGRLTHHEPVMQEVDPLPFDFKTYSTSVRFIDPKPALLCLLFQPRIVWFGGVQRPWMWV